MLAGISVLGWLILPHYIAYFAGKLKSKSIENQQQMQCLNGLSYQNHKNNDSMSFARAKKTNLYHCCKCTVQVKPEPEIQAGTRLKSEIKLKL